MSFTLRMLEAELSSSPLNYNDAKVVRAVISWFDAEKIDWECVGPCGKVVCTSRASLTERTAFFASLEAERVEVNGSK